MTLEEFMQAERIATKSELARRLDISPQSLNQFLQQGNSSKFQFLIHTFFPDYSIRCEDGAYVLEQKDIISDAEHHAVDVHDINKTSLLQYVSEYPSLCAFVAATNADMWEVYFETPANNAFCFSLQGRVVGTFSTAQYFNFASALVSEF